MTARTLTLLAWIWACKSNSDPQQLVEGGTIVAIDEGGHRVLALTSKAELIAAPAWATIDANGSLDLAPPCDAIKGTSGPPHEIVVQLGTSNGTVPVLVELSPSGEGACRPTLVACVKHFAAGSGGNGDGKHPCDAPDVATCGPGDTMITGTQIPIDFRVGTSLFSDPAQPDEALVFQLNNPGCPPGAGSDTCDLLTTAFSTDAPIKIPRGSAPLLCGSAANSNVTSAFDLLYQIVRGDDATSPVVTSGGYSLQWNQRPKPMPYGAEVISCAADGTQPDACVVTRQLGDPQWRLCKRSATATLTVQLRLWASQLPTRLDYDIVTKAKWMPTGPSIALVVPPRRGSDSITFPVKNELVPLDMTLEVGPDLGTFTLRMNGSGSNVMPPFDEFGSDFVRDVEVYAGSGGSNFACP